MVARTRHEPDALVLSFERDGAEPERKLAKGSHQALLYAVGMLIEHDELLVGDRLSVKAADDDDGGVDR